MADQPPRQIICGLSELPSHCGAGVTHIVSILDPGAADPADFVAYPPHKRLTLRFHDIIAPAPGMIPPQLSHVETLLAFGREDPGHLLVHCHMGVSRSTAAAAALLVQGHPEMGDEEALAHVVRLRPQAWPNSRIVAFADFLLGRRGRLNDALRRFYNWRLLHDPDLAEALRGVGRGDEVDMAG